MDIGKLATEMNRGFIQLLIMVMLDEPMRTGTISLRRWERRVSQSMKTLCTLF